MKVELKEVPTATLEEFADAHDLTMEVQERGSDMVRLSWIGPDARYFASFKDAEIKDGTMLRSAFGDGPTPETAMAAYARQISEQTLVVGAYTPNRRVIKVPRLM